MDQAAQLLLGYEFQGPRKIDLPESILQSVDVSALAESPLIYRVTSPGGATFVGVREFSAPEGQCGINQALAKQLGLEKGDALSIERVHLPRGTQVTLSTAADTVDWKSLLEIWLPQNCTALGKGDVLNVEYAGRMHELQVLDVAPESPAGAAVCVVDTDMDLIIETATPFSTEKLTPPPKLELNKEIDLGPDLVTITANVPPGVDQLYIRSSEIAFIGPEYATSPTSFLAVASAPLDGPYTVVSTALLSSSFSVAGSGTFSVHVEDPRLASVAPAPGEDERRCTNCMKNIPAQSFVLHSNFCERNSVKCSLCERRFFGQREVPSDHWHCPHCDVSGEGDASFHETKHLLYKEGGGKCACLDFVGANDAELAFHCATTCSLRNHECQFCHLIVPQGETTPVDAAQDLTAHESQCGNRTTDCPLCERPIRIRSLKAHLQEHEQQRRQRRPPLMCSNRNCPNVIRSGDGSPALGLCPPCFGPLSVPGANSDVSRILARAERRYLLQMTRGCGKSWCQNQFCKTGSGVTKSVADCMTQIGEIQKRSDQYFCVDEASTRKAMFVQLDDGMYERGWRGMAITSCSTETEASQWLERNASRLNE